MELEEQRSRGREARESEVYIKFGATLVPSQEIQFVGYDRLEAESGVLAIYGQGEGKSEAVEGAEVDLITGATPFYGESGGQVGDRGTIETTRGDRMGVVGTQQPTAP